jgi:hypothetical protein
MTTRTAPSDLAGGVLAVDSVALVTVTLMLRGRRSCAEQART